ncbi:MAG: peptidylprolyl isomerase [Gemmatimonadetes bacterium]|nr:peptidylprolyl isomerase [Gemmatimonadota bacterium]
MISLMHARRVGLVVLLGLASARSSAGAQASSSPRAPTAAQLRAILRNPAHPHWKAKAPDTVQFDMETSKGTMTVELIRAWAPHGVDRFYNLARAGFYDDQRFYRVILRFIAQFGIAANPLVNNTWGSRKLPVDSVRTSNTRGTITFAQYNPGNRTTNVFINLSDNAALDTLGFAPIGRVIGGMEAADSLHFGYGELPSSPAPLGNPKRLYAETNKFLDAEYPKLDRILRVVLREAPKPGPAPATGRP